MKSQTKAYVYALLAVAAWSTVAAAFKIALRHVSPDQLILFAAFTAMLILGIAAGAQKKLGDLRTFSRGDWARSALAGLLNPFLYYVVLFRAFDRLPGQEAQPLNYIWAITLTLLSIPLLKQKIRPIGLLAISISFSGVYVISVRGDLLSFHVTDPLGVSLAVGSSIFWALFWILNMRDRQDALVRLSVNFGFGFLFAFAFAAATGQFAWPSLTGGLACVYVGIFEMGLTFLLWLKALRLSRTTAQVSNLIFLSPFVSLILLHWIVGEEIYRSSIAGLALIVAGIIIQKRTSG